MTTEKPTEAEMTPVEGSSQIAAVGHKDGHLFITFKGFRDGALSTYRYDGHDDHPPHHEHHAGILAAESAGKYVNQHIKSKPYKYVKLS